MGAEPLREDGRRGRDARRGRPEVARHAPHAADGGERLGREHDARRRTHVQGRPGRRRRDDGRRADELRRPQRHGHGQRRQPLHDGGRGRGLRDFKWRDQVDERGLERSEGRERLPERCGPPAPLPCRRRNDDPEGGWYVLLRAWQRPCRQRLRPDRQLPCGGVGVWRPPSSVGRCPGLQYDDCHERQLWRVVLEREPDVRQLHRLRQRDT